MSKLLSLFTLVALLVGLVGVAVPAASAQATVCGTATEVTLFAGQTIDSGTVTVSNNNDYLYVTFTTDNGWQLSQTHLHVASTLASVPQTRQGNPRIGNFDYQATHNPYVNTFTYTIAKSALSLDDTNTLVIAAHAVVVEVDEDGNVLATETGWGDGERFVDRGSWAMYFQYTWQVCGGNGGGTDTETAFAFGGQQLATCFLDYDLNNDGKGDFNRWGWTNGPLSTGIYSFELWAGAGQCDISKGTLVGTVTVNYDGSTANVTFTTTGIYEMVETHLYVGSDILPMNNGAYTVAPGQYPDIREFTNGVSSDSYTVTGLNGDIYIVAHATVSGF